MKINWKLRMQNKTTLLAILGGALALVYAVLRMLGVAPAVTENAVLEILVMAVDLLVLLGVVTDPTTPGVQDSARAMDYSEPGQAATKKSFE